MPYRRSILSALVATFAACAPNNEPLRFDVSGRVTFSGKPIPSGRILFAPDRTRANQGPAGMADITDGVYSTAESGSGTVGGPHRVTIVGLSGKQGPSHESNPKRPLFTPYHTIVDLPKEQTTMDFEVPMSAAKHK